MLSLPKVVVKNNLVCDVLLTFSSQLFVMLSVFAVNKLVSMGLTVESFADYSLIRKNAALFTSLFTLGLTEALTHFYAYQQGRRSGVAVQGMLFRKAFELLLGSVAVFLAVFMLLHGVLSELLFDSVNAWRQLGLVYLFAVGSCVYQLLISYYFGVGDFKRAALVQIGVNGMYVGGAFFFANSVLLLFTLWSVLTLIPILAIIVLKLRSYPKVARNRARQLQRILRRRLLYYGATRMGTNLAIYGMEVLPLVMILHAFGQRAVSLFSVSVTVLLLVISLFSFTSSLFLQRVSLFRAASSYYAIRKLIRWAAIPFVAIALGGGTVLYYFAGFIVRLLYTAEFIDASSLIAITSFALLPKAFFYLLKSPIDAFSNRPYILFVMLISLAVYALLLWHCDNLKECAWAYVWVNILKMGLVVAIWSILQARNSRVLRFSK